MLYREIDVWERRSDSEAVVYRLWENLESGEFLVQSADFLRVNAFDELDREHRYQRLELLLEDEPEQRTRSFPTIAEAIAAHKGDFDGE